MKDPQRISPPGKKNLMHFFHTRSYRFFFYGGGGAFSLFFMKVWGNFLFSFFFGLNSNMRYSYYAAPNESHRGLYLIKVM